jgi:hypothetical protein
MRSTSSVRSSADERRMRAGLRDGGLAEDKFGVGGSSRRIVVTSDRDMLPENIFEY